MTQYSSTYTPTAPIVQSAAYTAPAVAKQVTYAANPLLSAGIVKTAGYHAGGIG